MLVVISAYYCSYYCYYCTTVRNLLKKYFLISSSFIENLYVYFDWLWRICNKIPLPQLYNFFWGHTARSIRQGVLIYAFETYWLSAWRTFCVHILSQTWFFFANTLHHVSNFPFVFFFCVQVKLSSRFSCSCFSPVFQLSHWHVAVTVWKPVNSLGMPFDSSVVQKRYFTCAFGSLQLSFLDQLVR